MDLSTGMGAVALVAAIAALWFRPGWVNAFSALNEAQERRIKALEGRVTTAEQTADAAKAESAEAKEQARAARSTADRATAETAKLVGHHIETVRGVAAGTVPPWLPIPPELLHRLNADDYPTIPEEETHA